MTLGFQRSGYQNNAFQPISDVVADMARVGGGQHWWEAPPRKGRKPRDDEPIDLRPVVAPLRDTPIGEFIRYEPPSFKSKFRVDVRAIERAARRAELARQAAQDDDEVVMLLL